VTILLANCTGFESLWRQEIFILSKTSKPALGPTNGYRSSYPGIKEEGLEAKYSLPSIAEVKNEWHFTSALRHSVGKEHTRISYLYTLLFTSSRFNNQCIKITVGPPKM